MRGPLDALHVVEDVLLVLRLLKPCDLRCTGHVAYVDEGTSPSSTQFLALENPSRSQPFELATEDEAELLALFDLVRRTYGRLAFPLLRFSRAFDRNDLDDKVLDLVVSAESLLLDNIDERDHSELRFRFALRAAFFIESRRWTRGEVFRIMRNAYDRRSGFVHGGRSSAKGSRRV
jgi:hypothetical protein